MKTLFLFFTIAFLALIGAQAAAAQNVCSAIETADGFVALRDRPSAKGRLIVRMRPGDFVVIERKGYEWITQGKWYLALHYRGGETFPEPGEAEYRKVKRGWVHESLVGECG